MTTVTKLHPAMIEPAQRAQALAQRQGRPAYLVLGPHAQVCADWPGVVCHRVHADGSVDCCVYDEPAQPMPAGAYECWPTSAGLSIVHVGPAGVSGERAITQVWPPLPAGARGLTC